MRDLIPLHTDDEEINYKSLKEKRVGWVPNKVVGKMKVVGNVGGEKDGLYGYLEVDVSVLHCYACWLRWASSTLLFRRRSTSLRKANPKKRAKGIVLGKVGETVV